MAAEPSLTRPPDPRQVVCSACKEPIPDPSPVVHCHACGWREKRGAD